MKRVKLPSHRSIVTSVLILNATFGSMSETTHGQVILEGSVFLLTSTWWHYKQLLPHSQQWNYLGRSPAAVRGRGRMLVAKPENQRIWERLVELPPWTCCTPTPSPSKYLKLCIIIIPKDLCGLCEHVQAPRAQLSISRRCDQAVWVGHPHHLGKNG